MNLKSLSDNSSSQTFKLLFEIKNFAETSDEKAKLFAKNMIRILTRSLFYL